MLHHLQVYLRQDRDLPLHFFKPPSILAPSDSRKIRLRDTTNETTTTPSYSAPLIRIDPRPDDSSPMTQHSWRSFASTHLAPIKDYLAQFSDQQTPFHHHLRYHNGELGCSDGDAKKQTSRTPFSSRKFANRFYSEPDGVTGTERIVLLPGWASRRYRAGSELSNRTGAPYDIEVFISGYVVKHKAPNALSRPQRTLLRLAKSFASLPKLPVPDLCHGEPHSNLPPDADALTNSEEDLLTKTILRDEDSEELEEHALHQSPETITPDFSPPSISHSASSRSYSFPSPLSNSSSVSSSPSRENSSTSHTLLRPSVSSTNDLHHRWHSNLETRLHPFWAGVLSNRAVRVSVRPHFDLTESEANSASSSELDILEQPLVAYETTTDADGAFKIRFVIHWESLCTHPKGAPMAFFDPDCEHDFSVTAELMPLPLPSSSTPNMPTEPHPLLPPPHLMHPAPIARATERVPLTYSPIRVISDIDDTVKLSNVHCGARVVFHNVFVKDLEENLIPGMGEWYSEMWRRGVRFHYVSNGPFELLPVITDFFQLAQLPTGSVRLRSYGRRSLFSDLLSAPSDRKRDSVLEVLSSFPHSRFILIGDSGEQDLELYASVARDHPDQILCIFIRDVNTYEDGGGGIEDPIGTYPREGKKRNPWSVSMSRGRWSPKPMSSQSSVSSTMSRTPSESTMNDYFSRTPSSSSAISGMQRPYTDMLYTEPEAYDGLPHTQSTITPATMPTLTHRLTLTESEKKRMSLQARLWKACAEVPTKVAIRVFCDPLECVEAFQVIDPHLAGDSN